MKYNKTYLLGELTLLFILIPCVLYFDISGFIKAGFVLIGIVYVIRTVIKNQLFSRRSFYTLPLKSYWKAIVLRFMLLIAINALVFCFAHIMFKNLIVLIITFIGGLIFAITFFRTRSLLLTSLEHALYGSWLFTVGMGEMLAFPMAE